MLKPRFGAEGTTSPDEQYARDLERAAGFKPITQQDLKTAYGQYGQNLGGVKRTDSDKQLYQKAVTTVLDWWKKKKADEAAASAREKAAAEAQARAQQQANNRASQGGAGSGGSGGGGGAGGSGGGSGGYNPNMLPDTAMPTGGTGVAPPKPYVPLTPQFMNQQLQRAGLAGAKPPAYALKNQETFNAWLQRAIAYKNRNQAVATKGVVTPGRAPTPAKTTVTTKKPIATNRAPVIR